MKKQKPEVRKSTILEAAATVALSDGYQNIQRADVAREAGCATGTVNHYFGTMQQLKRAVMRHAIANKIDKIVMQGLASSDPQAMKLSDEEKQRVCSVAINS